MTAPLPEEVERFRALLATRLGLTFEGGRVDEVANVLRERAQLTWGRSLDRYLDVVEMGDRDELRALAERLTVGETYFFRNIEQFHALSEVAVPERLRARGPMRPLRILSAGCASGEEPYTIAMCMARAGLTRDVSIEALDVNPAAVARARRARFGPWSLRETPAEARALYFRPEGRDHGLDPAISAMVGFSELNLVDAGLPTWAPASWDIVFCRNVLMYFPPATMHAVVTRLAGALVPGGFLFLGHAETLRGVSQSFHLRHTHGTFYYQRRDPGRVERDEDPPPERLLAPLAEPEQSWVDTIRSASERIARLAQTVPTAGRGAPESHRRPVVEVGLLLELLRQERYPDALGLVEGIRADAGEDPDLRLLHAVLLTHAGDLAAAESLCEQALSQDDLDAGARYLLALCREHAGDLVGAVENDQAAVYLDPAFAMPRLHLGMLARRAGDLAGARAELEIALPLLAREDAGRILLFGGGFSREALLGLCRAELRAVAP